LNTDTSGATRESRAQTLGCSPFFGPLEMGVR
jgi:hypothetical protein